MGLLRKAARAGAREPARASPAAKPAREGLYAGAGLLRKTLRFLASPRPSPLTPLLSPDRDLETSVRPAPAQRPPAARGVDDIVRRILDDCAALSDGVELPSRLFTSLKRNLSIVKGALLLYDPARLEYAPWASCGFDQTTLHRLRISLGANETFNALANGKPLSVTDQEQRNAFQACFSSREFASVARILLCPFIFDDTLAGVLLVTDLKAELENEDQLLECLARVAETASPLVQKARGRLTKGSGAPAARPTAETPEEQISRLLVPPAAGGKRFLFATVSLSAYSERIISSHEDLEPFRLSEDMRYFMDSFLADQGMAVMLSPNLFLVCLREYPQSSIDLFVHQLGLFLGSLFETESTKEAAAGITVVKSRVWPDEGSDVRQLIAFFSS